MSTPYRQSLTLPFFYITATDYCPLRITFKNSSTGLDLVVKISKSRDLGYESKRPYHGTESPGVFVKAILTDMPATRKDQPGSRFCKVQYRLSGARGVIYETPRGKDDKNTIAAFNSAFDNVTIVCTARKDSNLVFVFV